MKSLIYPALLAALLAGCSGTPSKDADIEDRAGKTETTAKSGEPVKIVEAAKPEPAVKEAAAKVETSALAGNASIREQAGKPADSVKTTGATGAPITVQSGQESLAAKPVAASKPAPQPGPTGPVVQTQGVDMPSSDMKPLGGGATLSAADASGQGGSAAPDAAATLPAPDPAQPSWADLKNPQSPLAQRRLLFDFDSAAIRDEYRSVLEAHVRFMQANKEARAILQGHADDRGSREYNLALGQRRSESVFKAMTLLGVPEDRLEAVSLGEEKPVAEGQNEEAWAQNRRTEILYQGE